ncbi:uncharacterized protein BJX67DRAFT_367113 [Aspergillus lucknowensis]|uniref:DNA-directed RNA polymerase III subunit RPC9 n=1 Tax=Aspergillus lucknowensis TaxID=176173 RepID=A0ABR4LAH4_9EURO
MRIIDPQSATLTNIEVLSYLSANPPRRPPNPPPGVNQRHWIPSPDLRDHNTVVKEIHNYAARLAPHLLRYPQNSLPASAEGEDWKAEKREDHGQEEQTGLDHALRELITRLQPYGLTKGEVLMIANLGIGLPAAAGAGSTGESGGGVQEDERMEVDLDHNGEVAVGDEGEEADQGVDGDGVEGEEGEGAAGDYGALALIDTVIEEREQRLSDENVSEILAIIRETLGDPTT